MKTRLSAGLGAGAAAALATAALMAGAGLGTDAGQPRCTSSAPSQKGAGFMPKGAPHQGDRLGFGDTDLRRRHRLSTAAVCTVVGRPQILCTIQVQLSKGTLTVQGMLPERSHNGRRSRSPAAPAPTTARAAPRW